MEETESEDEEEEGAPTRSTCHTNAILPHPQHCSNLVLITLLTFTGLVASSCNDLGQQNVPNRHYLWHGELVGQQTCVPYH